MAPPNNLEKNGMASKMALGRQLEGRAWRCRDGVVRWLSNLSTRGVLSIFWLDEERGVWHSGGTLHVDKFDAREYALEVAAPIAGHTIRVAGATGQISERVIPALN